MVVKTGKAAQKKATKPDATLEAILKEEPIKIPKEAKEKILEELRKATSPERVKDETYVLAYYRGSSFNFPNKLIPGRLPDMVVYPESTKEVQAILKIATKHKIPVLPVSRQAAVAAPPFKGGIVLDLMSMNRIDKVDTQHGYVVVEPGVTVAQLMEIIRPQGYTIGKGSYYSSFSVLATLASWIAQHNFANRNWDQAIGLEVVMPDGSIIYTGTKVYGDFEHWTNVQCSVRHIKDLFLPSNGTTGVITKAAIRIWPLLEKTAMPVFGFDDFESAFKWTHAMSKSSMVDQATVWNWAVAGGVNYRKTAQYLDWMEVRMKYYQDETPKELGLFNCFGIVQMRGYKEEIEGALKTAKRLGRQYGGKYVSETELQKKWPNLWKYWSMTWKDFQCEGKDDPSMHYETIDFSTQYVGGVEEIIKLYEGLQKKLREFGYKNWGFYSRMFYSGQAPWFRFFPPADGITQEDLQKSEKMRMSILEYAMENYKVVIFKDDFIFNDPDNPEEVNERAKPIRRLLSAVHNEFDPGNIMNPAIKKYTLL